MADYVALDNERVVLRPSASLPALGSAAVFFIVMNVTVAVWRAGDLSFWSFVVVGAMAGAVFAFVGVFLLCRASIQVVRRLPESISMARRIWIGAALVAIFSLVGSTAVLSILQALSMWVLTLPSTLAGAIAAALGFVLAMRAVTDPQPLRRESSRHPEGFRRPIMNSLFQDDGRVGRPDHERPDR